MTTMTYDQQSHLMALKAVSYAGNYIDAQIVSTLVVIGHDRLAQEWIDAALETEEARARFEALNHGYETTDPDTVDPLIVATVTAAMDNYNVAWAARQAVTDRVKAAGEAAADQFIAAARR